MANSKKSKSKSKTEEKEKTRELEFKQDMEEYAKVTGLLGDRKIKITLADGTESMGVIPGKFRKRVWIAVDDVVLVSKRSFEVGKMDVLHKYTESEIRNLIQYLEIPESFGKSSALMSEDKSKPSIDCGFVFSDSVEEQGEEDVNFDDI